ncbi:MAG: divergent polysaccharide deacetylase family protein [Pseudomonadota bacterium]|nr:divergent polysaccharide deacetylase family protein [Pseudomonadota bacterium]
MKRLTSLSHNAAFAPTLLALLFQLSAYPGQLAIVIDDVGYSREVGERVLALPNAVSIAVLPFTPQAVTLAAHAQAIGKDVLLHQPLESEIQSKKADRTLTLNMSSDDIKREVTAALKSIPGVKGVSNHTGSRFTQDVPSMNALMSVISAHGLFFLDSRTTARTVAMRVAMDWGVPAVRRDVFLDHDREVRAINAAFERALGIANRRGYAILIAHPHDITLQFLETRLPTLQKTTLVPVSSLTTSQSEDLAKTVVGFHWTTQRSTYSQSPFDYSEVRYSNPFVDGVPSTRGSIANAILKARPNALKMVSAWW